MLEGGQYITWGSIGALLGAEGISSSMIQSNPCYTSIPDPKIGLPQQGVSAACLMHVKERQPAAYHGRQLRCHLTVQGSSGPSCSSCCFPNAPHPALSPALKATVPAPIRMLEKHQFIVAVSAGSQLTAFHPQHQQRWKSTTRPPPRRPAAKATPASSATSRRGSRLSCFST